jgi:hypothetical protein
MGVTSDYIRCTLKNENVEESILESRNSFEIAGKNALEQTTVQVASTGQELVSEPKPEPEVVKKLQTQLNNTTRGWSS